MRCANRFITTTKIHPVYVLMSAFFLLSLVSGCSTTTSNRYQIKQDTAPNFDYGEITYTPIVPVFEEPNKWTAKPYQVLGRRYMPMHSAQGYEAIGQASWYGQKFHGHKTANGEIFDMFALTAAHKTLPLPSFAKVTNTQNGKSVIVRVNDRGPFHGNRILDLSYGAAKKLDFHAYGVTDIKLEIMHVDEFGDIVIGRDPTVYVHQNGELIAKQAKPTFVVPDLVAQINSESIIEKANTTALFVQVLAMHNGEKAKSLATGLSNLLQVPNSIPKIANVYKLQLGPLSNEQKAINIIQELKKIGFDEAFKVEVSL